MSSFVLSLLSIFLNTKTSVVTNLNPLNLDNNFWTPSCGQNGPVNYGLSVLLSFLPSVLPSGSFLGIGALGFSETQHGVRGLCGVVRDRVGFFGKKVFAPKMGKMGQKMGQN